MNVEALGSEIVSLFEEFGNVRELNDLWGRRFNYSGFRYNVKFELGFFKELYYCCRVSLDRTNMLGRRMPDGRVIYETKDDVLRCWNTEAQKIAPHFRVVREYEDDRAIRIANGDDYNYYFEALTKTRLKFGHLSFSKEQKVEKFVEAYIMKNVPKGTTFLDALKLVNIPCTNYAGGVIVAGINFPEKYFEELRG